MGKQTDETIVWTGRHLSIANRSGWEFAKRNIDQPAVGIVAIIDDRKVVLVEQYRPPLNGNVIELPAGLSGDVQGEEQESLLSAAQRELLEETGYTAARWTELLRGYSSPGLTDESIVLFLAEGLTKVSAGGGDGSEHITVHEIQFERVFDWLQQCSWRADLKLLAGLFAAAIHLRKREAER
ncbi:MAG TPA: NUDIX hydrolase [Pirellulales bacterium]|jgi:ADP-ribose pyrophosphatase